VNTSSFKDEAEGFEKSPLPQVVRLAAGEGRRPSPESAGFVDMVSPVIFYRE
jgi:hypothetical protein